MTNPLIIHLNPPLKKGDLILPGQTPGCAFADMVSLVNGFGFILSRTRGSHHIFSHPDLPELINLQEVGGGAKPYQIRQFLRLIEKYNITLEDK